ncbi:hypothetical protein [Paenibacillus sp.]|uniref:hypothetical protein n=1 Tax=Paenibacillus sp. TaxID=58172 RepID=UPI002D7646FC|nr:hypothetical protein [Paenibacillus sp.]HZG88551.1 hypothetical protein [Paenibacillus sp.]
MERSLWSRAWPAATSALASLGLHAAHVGAVFASSGAAASVHAHAGHTGELSWLAWAAWGANAIAAAAVGRLMFDYWRGKRRGQRAWRLLAAAAASTLIVSGSVFLH